MLKFYRGQLVRWWWDPSISIKLEVPRLTIALWDSINRTGHSASASTGMLYHWWKSIFNPALLQCFFLGCGWAGNCESKEWTDLCCSELLLCSKAIWCFIITTCRNCWSCGKFQINDFEIEYWLAGCVVLVDSSSAARSFMIRATSLVAFLESHERSASFRTCRLTGACGLIIGCPI